MKTIKVELNLKKLSKLRKEMGKEQFEKRYKEFFDDCCKKLLNSVL